MLTKASRKNTDQGATKNMELKDFVSQSLQQIIEGARDAQNSLADEGAFVGRDIVAPQVPSGGGNLIDDTDGKGQCTRVDFDVLVSAETSGAGKMNLKVFGVGAEGGGDHTASRANRLTFSIPVRLPARFE